MRLWELLSCIDENIDTVVSNASGDVLAVYNGKDSIPNELDDLSVLLIRSNESVIEIIAE